MARGVFDPALKGKSASTFLVQLTGATMYQQHKSGRFKHVLGNVANLTHMFEMGWNHHQLMKAILLATNS